MSPSKEQIRTVLEAIKSQYEDTQKDAWLQCYVSDAPMGMGTFDSMRPPEFGNTFKSK